MKEYKGWSLFNDIEDASLRTWNRCAVVYNMKDMKDVAHETYMEHVGTEGQHQMLAMFKFINSVGYDKARIRVFGELKAVGGVH